MKFIQSLEREGGHILTLAGLFIVCIMLHLYFPDSAIIADSAKGFAGALLYAMKGNGNPPPAVDAVPLVNTQPKT